jgi:hypothetical protein
VGAAIGEQAASVPVPEKAAVADLGGTVCQRQRGRLVEQVALPRYRPGGSAAIFAAVNSHRGEGIAVGFWRNHLCHRNDNLSHSFLRSMGEWVLVGAGDLVIALRLMPCRRERLLGVIAFFQKKQLPCHPVKSMTWR